jgi:DinB superfamily
MQTGIPLNLSYPIGRYELQAYDEAVFSQWLTDIKDLPNHIENAILDLNEVQLNTPYRTDGWTIKQVVHHVADSHMNAYTRFKLGLTENNPTIKPYDEVKWAEMSDVRDIPVNISLTLLHALHVRWHHFLQFLTRDDLAKTVYHPGTKMQMMLWDLLGMYAWHSRHHVAHITGLRERNNW